MHRGALTKIQRRGQDVVLDSACENLASFGLADWGFDTYLVVSYCLDCFCRKQSATHESNH